MRVLGIETSCDETSVAVVVNGAHIESNIIASQADLHAKYGGVVPEVASRKHIERMIPTILEALQKANCKYEDLDAIAVANRPGLLGALLVGVSAAKAIAYLLNIPLTTVHHLEGHIYSSLLTAPDLEKYFPFLIMIVSGGHTQIVRMDDHGKYSILGKTRDDAAGEAFDKGARLMGLPYPGGPNISKLADAGDPKLIRFPRSYLGDNLDFSFSGVKTSLRSFLEKDGGISEPSDVAAGYQAAIVDALVSRLKKAIIETKTRAVAVVGGVAANKQLGDELLTMTTVMGVKLVIPESVLCTDNAAMVASAGYYRLVRGLSEELNFDTFATEVLGS